MIFRIGLLYFSLSMGPPLSAQELLFTPELLTGQRSATYQHSLNYQYSDRVSLQHFSYYDSEYATNDRQIYLFKNSISYRLQNNFLLNAAMGFKNPGEFASLSVQYQYAKEDFAVSLSSGAVLQRQWKAEHSVSGHYSLQLFTNLKGWLSLLASATTDKQGYQRGFQHFRAGFTARNLRYGLAINLDQFRPPGKDLKNIGFFIRHIL